MMKEAIPNPEFHTHQTSWSFLYCQFFFPIFHLSNLGFKFEYGGVWVQEKKICSTYPFTFKSLNSCRQRISSLSLSDHHCPHTLECQMQATLWLWFRIPGIYYLANWSFQLVSPDKESRCFFTDVISCYTQMGVRKQIIVLCRGSILLNWIWNQKGVFSPGFFQ